MKCPACRGELRVRRSFESLSGKAATRFYECNACGTEAESYDKLTHWVKPFKPRLNSTLTDGLSAVSAQNPAESAQKTASKGTIGVSLSESSSGPDPTLHSSKQSGARARKGRGDAKEYTPEFEALWAGCKGRRGNKGPAFKAWLKLKPDTTLTIAAFNRMMASLEPWRTAKDFSTWLNVKGWEDEYTPYVAPPPSGKPAVVDPPWVVAEREKERQKGSDAARMAAAAQRMRDLERNAG